MTEVAHLTHAHEASLETSLDFINTLEFSRVASTEQLPEPEDAARWLGERGIAHTDEVLASLRADGGLDRFRALRAALRDVSEATVGHRPADPASLERINTALAARSRVELVPAPDGIALGHRHVGDALDDALATLADPVVHEIASGHRDRLRICANDTCRWVFFDESRTGRRRWCDMSTCGNRAKAARHRARTRGSVDHPG